MQTDHILKHQEFVDRLKEAKSEGGESWIVEMRPIDEKKKEEKDVPLSSTTIFTPLIPPLSAPITFIYVPKFFAPSCC